jgi:putative DNA-invertase from lambdoid prophage Rac
MERDLLIERTQAGLARAKAEGKTLGRTSKISPEQRSEILKALSEGANISSLARNYEVSRVTIASVKVGQTLP